MSNIEQLFQKYYNPEGQNLTAYEKRHRAEHTSNQYRNKQLQTARLKHRHLILDQLLNEINFTVKPYQIERVGYLIDRFNTDLKNLHRQSSDETIILALIMVQYKQENPKMDIGTMRISRKYKLTNHKFTIIQNRLIHQIMKTTELQYSQEKYVNQESFPSECK